MGQFLSALPPLLRANRADQKYEEAVGVAVEACAEDTMGQTCWICFDDGSNEGLVRMCSCRGGAGFAHVSCLARQAQVEVEQAEQRRSIPESVKKWSLWHTCRQCEQEYHGVVKCALGWACWKTYLGLPEENENRILAMQQLANGLSDAGRHEDALVVKEAELSMLRRVGATEAHILATKANLANTYLFLDRLEEALRMQEEVLLGYWDLNGNEHEESLTAAINYAVSLMLLQHKQHIEEAKVLLRDTVPVARRVLGDEHGVTLKMRAIYAKSLYYGDGWSPLGDLRESVDTLVDVTGKARRVFGAAHPITERIEDDLRKAREALAEAEEIKARGFCWDEEGGRRAWTKRENVTS